MDALEHPLDWWAYGGYEMVMRELGCTKAVARHKVRVKIEDYRRRTEHRVWKPIGNRGYAVLRRIIMTGRSLDNELR